MKGALAGIGVGLGVGTAIAGFKSMITQASDLRENVNKVKAIFGSGAASVIADSNAMAKAFGTSKNEYLDAASRMGGLFKGAGFDSAEVAKLSVQFVRLAGDASSFFNTDFNVAFDKLRSGLAGESEPLRDFGVFLTEDTVKAKALQMGLANAGGEISQQAKIQARAALIMKGLADAQGDLAKTSGEHAGRVRAFWGSLSNLGAELGTAFLPAATKVLSVTVDLVGSLDQWFQTTGIASGLGEAFSAIADRIESIVKLIDSAIQKTSEWGSTVEKLGWAAKAGKAAVNPVGALMDSFGIGTLSVSQAMRSTKKALGNALGFAVPDDVAAVNKPSEAAKMAEAAKKKAEEEKKKKAAAAPWMPRAGTSEDPTHLAGAFQFGSREAYSAKLQSQLTARNSAQEKLWAESKRTSDGIQRVAGILDDIRNRMRGDGELLPSL